MNISVNSEIGNLEGVIIHTPGPEIENMTPQNAERALYSDILNLNVARKEYSQFKGVLSKVTKTHEIKDLLNDVLTDDNARTDLITKICTHENKMDLMDYLMSIDSKRLSTELIEGVPLERNTLTKFLSDEYYAMRPLHNFFFTRDSAVSIRNKILVTRMRNRIRKRESLIVESIFTKHPMFETEVLVPQHSKHFKDNVYIEGGDVVVAREDILIIGVGARTSTFGVDFILDYLKEKKIPKHIIAQELPLEPESFIHLDMVFTMLDKDKCMVYPPVIFNIHNFETVHIEVDNGKVKSIRGRKDIPSALRKLGIDLEPIICGGQEDDWNQEREQWHSGANFVAISPGKVMGYSRNTYTLEEMNKFGFEIITAKDVIKNRVNIDDYEKCVVTMDGSELARGGGGCRCMSMPISRSEVNW